MSLPNITQFQYRQIKANYNNGLTFTQARQLVKDYPWILEDLNNG